MDIFCLCYMNGFLIGYANLPYEKIALYEK